MDGERQSLFSDYTPAQAGIKPEAGKRSPVSLMLGDRGKLLDSPS